MGAIFFVRGGFVYDGEDERIPNDVLYGKGGNDIDRKQAKFVNKESAHVRFGLKNGKRIKASSPVSQNENTRSSLWVVEAFSLGKNPKTKN